jgi:hypothetical protein
VEAFTGEADSDGKHSPRLTPMSARMGSRYWSESQ